MFSAQGGEPELAFFFEQEVVWQEKRKSYKASTRCRALRPAFLQDIKPGMRPNNFDNYNAGAPGVACCVIFLDNVPLPPEKGAGLLLSFYKNLKLNDLWIT